MKAPRSDAVVVVVDDDERILQLWVRFFWLLGCSVITAGSVPEAKTIVTANDVDILITDLNMPGANGLDLLEWLRGVPTGDMRVYVASGYHDQFAKEIEGYGVERVIAKPFHFQEELAHFRGVLAELAERG